MFPLSICAEMTFSILSGSLYSFSSNKSWLLMSLASGHGTMSSDPSVHTEECSLSSCRVAERVSKAFSLATSTFNPWSKKGFLPKSNLRHCVKVWLLVVVSKETDTTTFTWPSFVSFKLQLGRMYDHRSLGTSEKISTLLRKPIIFVNR